MRITSEAKQANREKILQAAARLFGEKGFEETTTRDIAQDAGLAVGTMFNYFQSKETLAMTMVNEALLQGIEDYQSRLNGDETLSEELFLFITAGLRRLRPMHSFIGPVLEKSLSPFPRKHSCLQGEAAREAHLAVIKKMIAAHGFMVVPESISVQIYWSLYLGILAFWAHDQSSDQEATLAMIDYSLTLFTQMISTVDPGGES